MSLTEQGFADMASKLQIKPEKLTEIINSDTESGFDALESPVVHFFNEDEKAKLEKNSNDEGYRTGKTNGIGKLYKDIKSEYPDVEAEDIPSLILGLKEANKKALTEALEAQRKEFGAGTNDTIEALKKNNEELDGKFKLLQGEYNGMTEKHQGEMLDLNNKFRMKNVDGDIMSAIGSLSFAVPDEVEKQGDEAVKNYILVKKNNAFALFKSQFSVHFKEDGKPFYKKGDEIMMDNVKDELSVDKFILDFAKSNYLSLTKEAVQGRGAPSSGGIPNGIKSCKSVDQLIELAGLKGIKPNTSEFDAYMTEWKKNQS